MRELPAYLREDAIADLEEIFDFITGNGGTPEVAIGFVRRIRARCEKIGHVPEGGMPRPDLGAGIRMVPFERSAMIAYRVHDDAVEILNIFYGGRDYESLMKE